MNVNDVPLTESLRVLMMPDYRIDNPYQTLLANALEDQGVEVIFPAGYRRVFPIFRSVKSGEEKIDILHLHWLSPYIKGKNILTELTYAFKFLIDILFTKLAGIKVVWTIHNYISHNSQFPNIERWTQQILINLADKVIIHNSSTFNELEQIYQLDRLKVEVIPHGHYREVYSSKIDQLEARISLELPKYRRIYLNLGILRPYKGIEQLLKVWQENIKVLGESTLVIAGKAIDPDYLEKLTQLTSISPEVILLPNFVCDEKIHLFYSAADIVVLPFEKILTSGSLMLAMSYNMPIVAPGTNGILETLGAAGWLLYNPRDDRGLLQSLKDSINLDLNILSNLVKQECDRLGWDNIGQLTNEAYQTTLTNSKYGGK